MAYWLMKSEPSAWSWADQVAAGEKGAEWDGVRNYQASNNLQAMQCGDRAFFYHSVKEKQIVGIVEVIRTYYPDPTDPKERFGMVDVKAVQPMTVPVSLQQIKQEPALSELALLKQSRLSVMPINKDEWRHICRMGKTKP